MFPPKNILFLMSGSIAANKSLELIKMFKAQGCKVRIACTDTTFEFIAKSELEALSDGPLIYKNFQNKLDMKHIDLGRWADITILCPATANTINQLAAGFGDNIVGTLFLAYELGKKPFVIAPAMNTQMYLNPATKEALGKLKNWGLDVLPTDYGQLACGEVGEGRLLEPKDIFNYINNTYFSDQQKTKILITAGATKEPIDGVRFITNFSSGKTGAKIADQLTQFGFDVTLITGNNSKSPKYCKNVLRYTDFSSLNELLQTELSNESYQSVIMTAAVSDYSVKHLKVNDDILKPNTDLKMSSQDDVAIILKNNFKIISRIKGYSKNKGIQIVGFKLTKTSEPEVVKNAVHKVFANEGVQFVVHNDLKQIESGTHLFNLYTNHHEKTAGLTIYELTQKLVSHFSTNINTTTNEVML